MTSAQYNVHEAKTQFSRLLERVEAGERIIIARAGKPVADLAPHVAAPVRLGAMAGRLEVADDAFTWPDADVSAMFYGESDAAGHA